MPKVDADTLKAIIEPAVQGQGYELVDVQWTREPSGWILRIFIDKEEGGVGLDDCAEVSHMLSATLDVQDVIPQAYSLEVSSPGLNRPLKKEKDFRRFVGKKARIRTRHPVSQGDKAPRRNFSGVLVGVEAGRVRIDVGDQVCDVPVDDVEKANLVWEFK